MLPLKKEIHDNHYGYGGHFETEGVLKVIKKGDKSSLGFADKVLSRHASARARARAVCVKKSYFGAQSDMRDPSAETESMDVQHAHFRTEGMGTKVDELNGLNEFVSHTAMKLCLGDECGGTYIPGPESQLPLEMDDLRLKTRSYQIERVMNQNEPRGLAAVVSPTRPNKAPPSSSLRSPRRESLANNVILPTDEGVTPHGRVRHKEKGKSRRKKMKQIAGKDKIGKGVAETIEREAYLEVPIPSRKLSKKDAANPNPEVPARRISMNDDILDVLEIDGGPSKGLLAGQFLEGRKHQKAPLGESKRKEKEGGIKGSVPTAAAEATFFYSRRGSVLDAPVQPDGEHVRHDSEEGGEDDEDDDGDGDDGTGSSVYDSTTLDPAMEEIVVLVDGTASSSTGKVTAKKSKSVALKNNHLKRVTKEKGKQPLPKQPEINLNEAKFASIKTFLSQLLVKQKKHDDVEVRERVTDEQLEAAIATTLMKGRVAGPHEVVSKATVSPSPRFATQLFHTSSSKDQQQGQARELHRLDTESCSPMLDFRISSNLAMRRQQYMDDEDESGGAIEADGKSFQGTSELRESIVNDSHHIPKANAALAPDDLMRTCLQDERQHMVDEERLMSAEYLLLFNGFCLLDTDKDGLVKSSDIKKFQKKFNCPKALLDTEIETLIWDLDETMTGTFRFHDIRELYTRAREEIFSQVAELQASFGRNAFRKRIDEKPLGRCKISLADPARRQSESWMLLRLLAFASLQNTEGRVHLLTALEHLLEILGKFADRHFMFIFGRDPATVIDSDTITLSQFIGRMRKDERHRLRARPLCGRERREVYDQKLKKTTTS